MFQTEYVVAGVAPLGANLVVPARVVIAAGGEQVGVEAAADDAAVAVHAVVFFVAGPVLDRILDARGYDAGENGDAQEAACRHVFTLARRSARIS